MRRDGFGRWGRGFNGFLDVDQAIGVVGTLADGDEDGDAQFAEGAATLHPVRGVDDLYFRVVIAAFELGHQLAGLVFGEEFFNGAAFLVGEFPEAFAEGNIGFDIVDALFGEMLPAATESALKDIVDGREVVALASSAVVATGWRSAD